MKYIFDRLGFNEESSLYAYTRYQDIDLLPLRINRSLHEMEDSPYAICVIENKPLVLFFDKSINPSNVFKQCWNFSETPIIVIENEVDYEVYNGYEYIFNKEIFLLKPLEKDNFNYLSLLSGAYVANLNIEATNNRLDKKLLENIRDAREKLLNTGLADHKDIVNALIGRIIFIRYLVDRKVILNFNGEKKFLTNNDLKVILDEKNTTYLLFNYLKSKDGFNGDWFPIFDEEVNLINNKNLKVLQDLISGTEIKTGQASLFDIYDFSIIPIEFISNVYESFIGEDEQVKNGAYYTPTFLVDYILKYTIDQYFKENPAEYNCKILDPACGSGIFLVETLRKLVSQFETINERSIEPKEIVNLVKDNIYAIDRDKNAILVSIFSLYITMLDYQSPKDIEDFTFPYLLKSEENPNPNFFENDFFDTEAEFNNILKQKNINFILGNPPYKRGGGNNNLVRQYIKKRTLIEKNNIGYSNKEIAQAFLIRSSDLNKNTQISFIVNSKILYNLQSVDFRRYFLENYNIHRILELSSVRKEVFLTATTPVAVLFYQYGKDTNNIINYISIKPSPYFNKFKMLFISKSDFKKVLQSKLKENDFLWKILIYGSYLDFNFIKRLSSYETLEDYITFQAQGITVGGKDSNPTHQYIGMPYVKTKQFRPFYIEESSITWNIKTAHRNKTIDIFKAPSLLISKGISTDLELKAAMLKKDSIFTDSITAVKANNENTLYNIMGILYSSLFKYLMLNTASSIGTEREQVHNPEKFGVPFMSNKKIIDTAKQIEHLSAKSLLINDHMLQKLKAELDQNILQTFELNEQEIALVDYATKLVAPWVLQKNYTNAFRKLEYQDLHIENYVKLYIEHYSVIYQQLNMYFQANIFYNTYAIGIYFKILDYKPDTIITWSREYDIENVIRSSGKHSLKNLFIQKDIKGFESDGFYIIKPNEYKNWHKAIAYLDFYEFRDAIIQAGRNEWTK